MKTILIRTFLFIPLLMLTACTTMNSSFDCPNKAGVNCKSLDQINSMVNSGEIRGRTQTVHEVGTQSTNIAEFNSFSSTTSFTDQPIRHGETVQRIWIAPYEDTEGNYHQESVIHAVMKNSHWAGRPVKPTTPSDE